MKRLQTFLLFGLTASFLLAAKAASPEGVKERVKERVMGRLTPILTHYCTDLCEVVNVEVTLASCLSDVDHLGFEDDGESGRVIHDVDAITLDIQIDHRVTRLNQDRLQQIVGNHLKTEGADVSINWIRVEQPRIGQFTSEADRLRRSIKQRFSRVVEDVFANYCPNDCVLADVEVLGHLVTADEASGYPAKEVFSTIDGKAFLRVDGVNALVSLSENLSQDERERILTLLRVRTGFVSPVSISEEVIPFPETHAKRTERERLESNDPHGLGKLRETLSLFRELAGTKEIISSTDMNKESTDYKESWAFYLLILAGLIVAGIVFFRMRAASNDAKLMVEGMKAVKPKKDPKGDGSKLEVKPKKFDEKKEMLLRLENEEIRDELVALFVRAPKVAKETFTRLIQEEGVEETAKYIHILGKVVVFELIHDPNLTRSLFELSEVYHKSSFAFSLEEENKLLIALKTKVVANEIKVLTSKSNDQFDFLLKLDGSQIFNLVKDEKPQLQSIVLTQLVPRVRQLVFAMFEGEARVSLMNELCKADAVPKEYLANVAQALNKKVVSRPEFDTESVRSSDVLLELLEKADLSEQRKIMRNLMDSNPDGGRSIKLRLVTIQMLPFLKPGLLLEIFMGMERDELLAFLQGTSDEVRDLILSSAPVELAESWIEDMEVMAAVDESRYHSVEIAVLAKVRKFAADGLINILEINDLIFDFSSDGREQENDLEMDPKELVV